MNAIPKKKLCWNCEGSVSLQQENCPYCGVYLSPTTDDGPGMLRPPYRLANEESFQEIPSSPFRKQTHAPENNDSQQGEEPTTSSSSNHEMKNVVLSLAFLLSGSVFFFFGIILFLFSEGGIFTLQWNGSYWFVYLLLGLPLLLLGWRFLRGLDGDDSIS